MKHTHEESQGASANLHNIVVIGGGSGIFPVLRGLKSRENLNVTAIVSMFDSGGSTGLLRTEFGVWPLGDLRRCLLALSSGKDAPALEQLFEYRFDKNSSLHGHNFGNLFLLALSGLTGDGPESIKRACELLHVKGNVTPVSLDQSNVCAVLEDGNIILGETNIDVPKHDGDLRIRSVYLVPRARAYAGAKQAIAEADVIIIGPGDLYTSLIPNLLVDGIPDALRTSNAKKVYITNIMTKWGETQRFTASDFAKEILSYAGLEQFDYIISNKKKIGEVAAKRYAEEKKYPVRNDEQLGHYAKHVILSDLFLHEDVLRHDSECITRIVETICRKITAEKRQISGEPRKEPRAQRAYPTHEESPARLLRAWAKKKIRTQTGKKRVVVKVHAEKVRPPASSTV